MCEYTQSARRAAAVRGCAEHHAARHVVRLLWFANNLIFLIPAPQTGGKLHYMETSQGMLGRLTEKVIGWVALALIVGLGIAIWQMPAESKAAVWSGVWRSAAWLGIAAVLPWSARFVIRRIIEIGSNWASFGLLVGFSAADVVAGVLLMTVWPGGGWAWFACVALLGVAGSYNYLVTEYLAEMNGG